MRADGTGRLVILSGPSCVGKSPLRAALVKFHPEPWCQKGELSLAELENIETRARSAYCELQEAWRFQHVIPNHDGEDSENWDAFYYPVADARKALEAVAALIEGAESPPYAERWDEELLPPEPRGAGMSA